MQDPTRADVTPQSANISPEATPTHTPSFPTLQTPKEIAALLKVSPKSVYYWVKRNEIPYIRVGRHLRFNPEVVLNWLAAKTEEGKPACFQSPNKVQSNQLSRSLKNRNVSHSLQTKGEKNGY